MTFVPWLVMTCLGIPSLEKWTPSPRPPWALRYSGAAQPPDNGQQSTLTKMYLWQEEMGGGGQRTLYVYTHPFERYRDYGHQL